jgi:hypothetical protein
LRVAQFLANLWQGPCTAVHGMDAGAILRSPAHSRLAPQVQCCPQKKWVEGTAQGNETKASQAVLGQER